MEYTITVSDDEKYIILKVTGEINRQLAMEYTVEAHAVGRQKGIHRYLMDATEAVNTDRVLENYNFFYKDLQNTDKIDRHARVATLVNPGDNSHSEIETLARNSGFDITFFTDWQEAVEHLTRDA